MTLVRNQQGQISIFFSASMVVMITIVAFIINIGLFVKAKINLQNATDSAAFAGASVQARQLSKIAYLNWEMRNIYKEWLYKYYVVGNLNINDVENVKAPSGTMQFKLQKDVEVLSGQQTEDKFNIPAVCIHIAGSKTNICKRYSVPGLPEFGSTNLVGAEEASRAFMDTLISTKVNDCIDRTRLNMLVANTWTYNVLTSSMDNSLAGRGPAILSDRQGAWPRAVELALRVRNLEYVMNRPAERSKICASGTTPYSLTSCNKSISTIEQESKLGNERIVKAFYSAYRNLGNDTDSEMKQSFTLTELPPKQVTFDSLNNASVLLVPKSKANQMTKQWVDLKLMMVNYAIFYAAMIPRASSAISGACDISKVAIPVPGYPLGFYKNPDVLTYYAVKGEAEFVGMFNPFQEEGVKLEAFSAAKPMGGRIGPMLFTQRPNEGWIIGRTDKNKYRSVPYITSYDFNGTSIRGFTYNENTNDDRDKFIPGLPLPTNSKKAPGSFWLEDSSKPVGGLVADAGGVQFGVPNMVYDYETPFMPTGYTLAKESIYRIETKNTNEQPVGLFSRYQFNKFRGTNLSANISPSQLDDEIARVKAPTLYEAANYMIPTPNLEFNMPKNLDSFGFISGQPPRARSNGIQTIDAQVYAPLYKTNNQEDLLFTNQGDVFNTIKEFMTAQETGMRKYMMSMNRAADIIWKQKKNISGGAAGSAAGYEKAAKGISDINFTDTDSSTDIGQRPGSCASLSGQFLYFYYGNIKNDLTPLDPTGCPKPLADLLREYFASSRPQKDLGYDPTYYSMVYSYDPSADYMKYMTAYSPGPKTGASLDGSFISPLNSSISDKMRRNFYSTKFITLDSLQASNGATYSNSTFMIISEGAVNPSGGVSMNTGQKLFANPLETSEDISSIKY
jgi:hypothetical protein